jgi:FixJ family two-component response regulator
LGLHSNGLGIGLSIVRRALEVLGHRIEVRSVVGEGKGHFSRSTRRQRQQARAEASTQLVRVSQAPRPIRRCDPRSVSDYAKCSADIRCMTNCMRDTTNEKALVHVVDDDASMRGALEGLFDSVGLQTQTYAAAKDFLSANISDRPGCIVLDVRLPDMNGLEFQTRLIQIGVGIPVVMMTGYGDIPMSVRAMKHGAVDFLPKPFRDQDMLDAVLAAIERDRQRRIVEIDNSLLKERFETLSPREQEVMLLVTTGKMNKQAAGDLGISEITVKIHRGAAMHKMGARSYAELVRMADALKPNRRKPGG